MTSPRPHRTHEFLLALGIWVLTQVAAVSYARGGASTLPAPRYGDIFAVGLIANAFALALLAAERVRFKSWPMIVRAAAGGWFILVAVSIGIGTAAQVHGDLANRKAAFVRYEKNVQTFVLTDDYNAFDKQQPNLPFPFTDWLARILRNPSLRRILPVSVRSPVAVPELASTPAQPDDVPPLSHRPTRLVRAGQSWQSVPLAPASGYWKIETAGDLGRAGAVLDIVSVDGRRILGTIKPSKIAGPNWRAAYVRAPREPALLQARVDAPAQWIAFSEPVAMSALSFWVWRFTQQAQWFALAGLVSLASLLCASARRSAPQGEPPRPSAE